MEYRNFLESIKTGIESVLGSNYNVELQELIKNNDEVLDAIIITGENTNISPTIYMQRYFRDYCEGKDIQTIINEILSVYADNKNKVEFNIENFKQFNKIKKSIVFKVINTESNKILLEKVPYIPYLDLAIVFYCLIDAVEDERATILIQKSHLDLWKVSVEEIFEISKINTPILMEYDIRTMQDVIKDIIKKEFNNDEEIVRNLMHEEQGLDMYILSNKQMLNGAACMLYEDLLSDFADVVKKDLYILPSSVHEIIILPMESGIKREELDKMVKEVNVQEVANGDILSDHSYIFDRKEKILAY